MKYELKIYEWFRFSCHTNASALNSFLLRKISIKKRNTFIFVKTRHFKIYLIQSP